jgi:hypothetical protein
VVSRLAAAALLSLVAPNAWPDLSHDFIPIDNAMVLPGDDPLVPDFNDGSYFTFDLVVTVENFSGRPDDWFAAVVDATIAGPGEFFQHPLWIDIPPPPGLFEDYPAVEFDSYFAGAPGASIVIHTVDFVSEPTYIHAYWWDMAWPEEDVYPIARFTVHWLGDEPATLTLNDASFNWHTQSPWQFDFTVTIPEPSAAALLAFGGLVLIRSRRHRV